MLAHEVDRGAVDWVAVQVGGASWENLDPLEFERLRRLASSSGTGADGVLASLSDREIASALGLVRSDADVTAGALLLFGKSDALRRFLPTHEAAFQVLRGEEVEVNDFLPYPLLRLAEEMFSRFRARNREEEMQSGLFRIAVSTYSETAFREALANALIHRDYTRPGAVHVQWREEQPALCWTWRASSRTPIARAVIRRASSSPKSLICVHRRRCADCRMALMAIHTTSSA